MQRRVSERAESTSITQTGKHEGSSVMALGFVCGKVGDLHQVKGKLNQTGYHNILLHLTIPSGTWLVNKGFILLQDNDPNHASKELHLKQRGTVHPSTDILAGAISGLKSHKTGVGLTGLISQS